MDLKPSYKQTELGVIPENWDIADFDTLGTVIDGDRGANYPNGNDFNNIGDCLFLNAGNVTKNGFKFVECAFITHEKDTLLNKGKLKRNDVVLTTRGTVGNFAFYDRTVPLDNIRINSGMVILRNSSQSLDMTFLYTFLRSHLVESQIERLSFGSAQPQLTVKDINRFKITIPPLLEQRVIAKAISDIDALIASLDKLIVKKRNIKQGAMQQLLTGKKRLPGFNGVWVDKTLGDIASITMGQSPSSSFYNNRGIGLPLIQGNADIKNRKTIIRNYTSQITKRCFKGDIILSVRAPVGEVAIAIFNACIGRGVCAISYPNDFLYHYLIFIEPQWGKLSKGSTFDSVNSNEVKALGVKLPDDFKEQTAIAKVLSDMDAEITAIEARRDKTKAIKQGMMQTLLTGRIRLI
jgi:type I restriction enzyme S subunit